MSSIMGKGDNQVICEYCNDSRIEFISAGHGNVLEIECSMCKGQEMKDKNVLSSEGQGICECCEQPKLVRMYMLQNCTAAFVCQACRTGKPEKEK